MKANSLDERARVEAIWRQYLTTGQIEQEKRQRRILRMLPGTTRCGNCYAPMTGSGAWIARLIFGKRPSSLNPKLCNVCERFAREHQGGAEIELSLLFGDVRGSTTMAEEMSPMAYSQIVSRFYRVTTKVMVDSNAFIDKIIGDQVSGMYVPGFAGADHARRAVEAAQEIMRVTGNYDAEGPWVPLGAGVHTGIAFMGAVGSEEGMVDITVLGDAPNTAARLSGSAGAGEILISEAAFKAAGLQPGSLEQRVLELKGKTQPVKVYVLTGQRGSSATAEPGAGKLSDS